MFRYATSLAARHATLWVARWDRSWRIVPHDFDGRRLSAGFVVAPEDGPRADVRSIAVDEDRRIWVVDSASDRVRVFTAFGRELAGLPRGGQDTVGSLTDVEAVDATGVEDALQIAVTSRGARRHALHLVGPEKTVPRERKVERDARPDSAVLRELRAVVSVQPRDKDAGFAGLARVACGPRGIVVACEPSTGLVHVWRDGRFHFAFRTPGGSAPTAVRVLRDGRMVVASAGSDEHASPGAIHLVDAAGRPLRRLAEGGEDEGAVCEPEDLALDESRGPDRRTRVVVADLAGTRLQVFNLEGDCYGAFGAGAEELESTAESAAERAVEPS